MIRQREAGDLDRIVHGHELQQLERHAVRVVRESCIAVAVSHHVFATLLANGQRRRTPQLSRVVIANVEHLARRIAHRIVRPGGEEVLLAVDGPRAAGPRLGDEASEVRVGDHVDPGRRRPLSRAEDGHVLAAVGVEAAEAVEELEVPVRLRNLGSGRHRWRDRAEDADRAGIGTVCPRDLLGEGAAPARERNTGGSFEAFALRGRHRVRPECEHLPLRLRPPGARHRLARLDEGFDQGLQILHVGGRAFVQDHEIDCQTLCPPVRVRAQKLMHAADVVGVMDLHEDDGKVPRDAVRPERSDSFRPARKHLGGGAQRRIQIQDGRAERLEQLRFSRVDAEVAKLDLCLRAGECGDALERRDVVVRVREVEHSAPRRCHERRECRVDRLAGTDADTAAETDDRVEHRADGIGERCAVHLRLRARTPCPRPRNCARSVSHSRSPIVSPWTARTWASQISASSGVCLRRVASNVAHSAMLSVWMNRFENAGWAASAAAGASTTSAYDVTSISRVAAPWFVSETRRSSASSSGDTITSSRVAIAPSLRMNSARSSAKETS